MQNSDINDRFTDWLLSPTETLDWEAKCWLDMADPECQGLVAKELIALENHGGGFLVFGFKETADKQLVSDANVPVSLKPYMADAINAILKKRAEPVFHADVTLHKHPVTGQQHPLVRVAGTSKIPVRSDSATKSSLKNYTYYIRASGPESRAPLTGAEWDSLIRRAVSNQREETMASMRGMLALMSGDTFGLPAITQKKNDLSSFVHSSISRWSELNESLEERSRAKIMHGHYLMAARIAGTPNEIGADEVLRINQSARRYTGWPPFVAIYRDSKIKPHPRSDGIEAWIAADGQTDVGHADYWLMFQQAGLFFLLRGYQEDAEAFDGKDIPPATRFEATLPVWRVGEFVLRIGEFAEEMYKGDCELEFECRWVGLAGRQLFVHRGHRWIDDRVAHDDEVTSHASCPASAAKELLPDVVKKLTSPLYQRFDFFAPQDKFYSEELANMTGRKY
jgi:hypothetical protein